MITGTTKIYGIIADPIKQVRTPEVFNKYFKENDIDAVLVPINVAESDLSQVVEGLKAIRNLGGFIVTVPHKTNIVPLCDELGKAGEMVGSVNTIRRDPDGRLIGNMFDGLGFVGGLRSQGYEPAGKKVLLLGAGGAASAIAFALAEAGVSTLAIANRTKRKAQQITERVAKRYPDLTLLVAESDPKGYQIIINSTSLGMNPDDQLPIAFPENLTPEMIVADIIMKPETTALLEVAEKHGCLIHYGRHMLDQQIKLMARFLDVGEQ